MIEVMIQRIEPPDDGDPKKPYDPLDKDTDCFKPPSVPTEVGCLHCQRVFMSDQMVWRIMTNPDGEKHGFWCCPDQDCDGKGFGFDLLPTDPNYRDENGEWVYFESEDEDEYEFDDDQVNNDFLTGEDDKPDSFDPPRDWTGDEDDIPF